MKRKGRDRDKKRRTLLLLLLFFFVVALEKNNEEAEQSERDTHTKQRPRARRGKGEIINKQKKPSFHPGRELSPLFGLSCPARRPQRLPETSLSATCVRQSPRDRRHGDANGEDDCVVAAAVLLLRPRSSSRWGIASAAWLRAFCPLPSMESNQDSFCSFDTSECQRTRNARALATVAVFASSPRRRCRCSLSLVAERNRKGKNGEEAALPLSHSPAPFARGPQTAARSRIR